MAQARNSAGNSFAARDPATALRDVEAVRLRAQDMTFQQIADALGMANKSVAKRAVDRVLDHVQVEAAEEYRAGELTVLLAARQRLVQVMYARHLHVSDGRVVRDEVGELVLDDGPAIAAARALQSNSESLRKLLGLDAPTHTTVTMITEDALDAELQRLEAEIGRLGGTQALEAAADQSPAPPTR